MVNGLRYQTVTLSDTVFAGDCALLPFGNVRH